MKTLLSKLYVAGIFFSLIILSSCSDSEDPNPKPDNRQEDIDLIDSKIEAFLSTHNLPGASLAISKNGQLVYQKAFGLSSIENNTEMTIESRMRVASVSKTFTGTAIMLLVQDGKISLDDKVFGDGGILGTTYGTKAYNDRVKKVTIRNLMQMTTGGWVVSGNRDAIDYQQDVSNTQFFNWMMDNATLNFEPGSQYWYINTNYFVAARIIEKVSGKPFAQFLKERIFDPLEMKSTVLAKNGVNGRYPNEATYYGLGGTKGYEYNFNIERRDGDAGIVTTASDLLRFVNAIDNYTAREDLMTPQTYAQFIKGSTPNAQFGIGVLSANPYRLFYGALPGTRSSYLFHTSNGMAVSLIFNGNADYTASNYNNFAIAHENLLIDLVTKNLDVYQDIDQF